MPVSSTTTPTSSTHAAVPISRQRTPRVATSNDITNRLINNLSDFTLPPFHFPSVDTSISSSTSNDANVIPSSSNTNNDSQGNTETVMTTQYNGRLGKTCAVCRDQGSSNTCCKHERSTSSYCTKNKSSDSYATSSKVSQLSFGDSNINNGTHSNNMGTRGSGGKMTGKQKIRLLTSRNDDDRWVDLSDQRVESGKMGHLYGGSQFIGVQKGAACNYDVSLDILHVDLENDVLCGYLHVTGLTTLPPKITTYFEGEIIGRKYSFLTRKWLADLSVDSKHWKRFPSFAPFADTFNDDDFSYDPVDQDFVYMRWKEKFLVPNHHVNSIDGASYAGFYYICYQRSTESINGFYYCRNNIEWFQELVLSHVPQRHFARFEFR